MHRTEEVKRQATTLSCLNDLVASTDSEKKKVPKSPTYNKIKLNKIN
jgi:hypothetical protein